MGKEKTAFSKPFAIGISVCFLLLTALVWISWPSANGQGRGIVPVGSAPELSRPGGAASISSKDAKRRTARPEPTGPNRESLKLWSLFSELDMGTGKASQALNEIDGNSIKLPGYMIPLEIEGGMTSEFLVVPTLPSCIHVPPPAPNNTVHVKMKSPVRLAWEPVWVEGKLNIVREKRMRYGEASFEMAGLGLQPLKEEEFEEFFNATLEFDCFGADRNHPACLEILGALPADGPGF